jgi:hypothetical protein
MNEYLWITQMRGVNDVEITELECPAGTFKRLHRIFSGKREIAGADLLITLRYENGDLADDDPLCIADHHGLWLLRDFFKAPKSVWKKVKVKE